MVVWKAGREQGLVELGGLRDANRLVVQERAFAFHGAEALVAERIVDQAKNDLLLALKRDRDRDVRKRMREVGRAVERIDDPAVDAARRDDGGRLLGEDRVAGVALGEMRDDRFF